MEKQELKSKWDELARELGAEISPEIEQREEAVSAREAPVPPRQEETTAATVRPPLPKPAGWDSLAGELGLPTVEPPPRTEEIRPPAPREPVQEPAARRPQQRERSDRSRPAGQRREATEQRREPAEKRRETRERPEKRREKPAHELAVPPETRSAPMPRQAAAPPAAPPRQREEPPKPPAAVSLWHKIFGSPAEQSAKLTEPSSADRPEPSRSDEAQEEPPSITRTEEIRSLSGEDVTAAGFVEELERADESKFPSKDDISEDRTQGRPRRRRRGGRGRKSATRTTEERPAARHGDRLARVQKDVEIDDDLPDLDIDDELLGPDDRLGDTDLDETDDSEEGTTGSDRSRASQRAIPSWDEAIGFIVDSNMQSRSQRRPPSRSDSRGNSSRGRSRGRRKT